MIMKFASPMRALLLAMPALACTQTTTGTPLPPECAQEGSQVESGGDPAAVAWLGAVKLIERRDAENNVTQGTAAASFYDVRGFSVEQPTPLDITPTCLGITGMPVQTGTRTALAVDRVEVTGTSQGALTLTPDTGGSLSAGPFASVFNGSPVGVNIVGTDGGYISAQVEAFAPPPSMEVSEPSLSGSFSTGGNDVVLRWNGRGTGTIAIDLVTGAGGTSRAALSCIVVDDGCHVVPAGAIQYITQGSSDPITVTVRRAESRSGILDNGLDGGAGTIVTLQTEARGRINP